MAANTAAVKFKVKATVFSAAVIKKIHRWQMARLGRAGAYGRGVMKKQIKPELKGRRKKEFVTVPTDPADFPPTWKTYPSTVDCIVQKNGPVLDAKTMQPVTKHLAMKASIMARIGRRGQGEGQPPRRGPTDKLRQGIRFERDESKPSVVIGVQPFSKQPTMMGRKTVPELLNKGGIEIILGESVTYGPRPYVETVLKATLNILRQDIKQHPINNRI
jgi:hypothetical protein